MKRMLVLLAVVGAFAAIVVPISAAANSNGASVTHMTPTSYYDGVFGQVNCYQGDNVSKAAPKPMNQDTEDCTILSGGGIGVYTYPNGNYPGWASDFTSGPSQGKVATSVTITVTANADGSSNEHIVANYLP